LENSIFFDDIIFEATLDENIILTLKSRSLLINAFNHKDHSVENREYSEQIVDEVDQMSFGLDFGGQGNGQQ